jgi:hypothetical protein
MKGRHAGAAVIALALGACGSPGPASSDDVEHDTGLSLCPSTDVQDLTTQQERDTAPGISYHVKLTMDGGCAADLERQLSAISSGECTTALLRSSGCSIRDASAVTGRHTSISVMPVGPGQYDVRFSE